MPPEYFFEKDHPLLKNGGPFLLFLDFDGTLTPIRDNPGDCFLSAQVKGELEGIASSPIARIAILSGRSLPDLRKRVGMRNIYYGGNHGLEISGPDMRYIHPGALSGKHFIDRVRRGLENKIVNIGGALIEPKKLTFTLHYRMAGKEKGAFLRKAFYRSITENTGINSVMVIKGKKVLELAPNVSWDRGKAALFIFGKLKQNCLPIYVGDDLTDETAFQTLREKGLTIRVGFFKKTAAQYFLKGQWEITRFLGRLNRVFRSG